MKPMVLTLLAAMCAAIAIAIWLKFCGVMNTHGALSAAGANGAMEICGVFVSNATSRIAIEVGVAVDAMSASTLSSPVSLRAFFTAVLGSVASSSTMYLTFSPPMVCGNRANVCFSGMPSDAAGPVAETLTPMVMSAQAEPAATTSASACTNASFLTFMSPPVFCGVFARRNMQDHQRRVDCRRGLFDVNLFDSNLHGTLAATVSA